MEQCSATVYLITVKRCVYHQMKRIGSDLLKAKYKAISNLVRSQTRKGTSDHVTNFSTSYFASSNGIPLRTTVIQSCLSSIMIHQFQMTVARLTFSTNSFILHVFTIED